MLGYPPGMAASCGGSPIIFLLPVSDRLLISERNVSYLGLHTSFTEHKNKTLRTVSGENGRHVPFFFLFFPNRLVLVLTTLIAGRLEALMVAIKR